MVFEFDLLRASKRLDEGAMTRECTGRALGG